MLVEPEPFPSAVSSFFWNSQCTDGQRLKSFCNDWNSTTQKLILQGVNLKHPGSTLKHVFICLWKICYAFFVVA